MPKVFISYSWEDDEHKCWVRFLADKLLENGIDTTLDQYDLSLGDRLPLFMEKSVTSADYVLIICTPTYKKKSDARKGGVGYEGHIISGELFSQGNDKKFIPVIRKGSVEEALPVSLTGKLAIDLSDDSHFDKIVKKVVEQLNGITIKPPITKVVTPLTDTVVALDDEPVSVLGIVEDEITVPRMDGTFGSALYRIPFRLSKKPSNLWKELFIQTWNAPPKFSSMHRPGIASVYGNEIILDGTTIEEVRDYHKETVLLCVDEANKKEKLILEDEKRQKEQKATLERDHCNRVSNIVGLIKF